MSLTTTDKQDIKVMIREGIAHLPTMPFIRSEIDRLEGLIQDTNKRVSGMEVLMEDNTTEISRLGVLNEDVSHKVNAILEIVSVFADNHQRLENHEVRLEAIESRQPLIINTLKLHSKQLKS